MIERKEGHTMPTVTLYHQADCPPLLKWQAIAFMRVEWPFVFRETGKFAADTYPPELTPVHFVAAEGDALISYAAVLRLVLDHADTTYTVSGLGNMFTFPSYRREGYGRQVLDLATHFIRQSDVDVAILFCDPTLESFYTASGWEPVRSPTYVGLPSDMHAHDVLKMMLFVSDKGKTGKAAFASVPLMIEEAW
jgi:GNAT superfamily N-acetyltransferase